MNKWERLSMFMAGVALFIMGMKSLTFLESAGDYTSPIYVSCLSITWIGVFIGVYGLLELYIMAKKEVESIHERKDKN